MREGLLENSKACARCVKDFYDVLVHQMKTYPTLVFVFSYGHKAVDLFAFLIHRTGSMI